MHRTPKTQCCRCSMKQKAKPFKPLWTKRPTETGGTFFHRGVMFFVLLSEPKIKRLLLSVGWKPPTDKVNPTLFFFTVPPGLQAMAVNHHGFQGTPQHPEPNCSGAVVVLCINHAMPQLMARAALKNIYQDWQNK
jgi:hypothetical protein